MYLKRLELQGFKTFAQKTILEFMTDRAGRRGITGVVGPNGSGKSNIADAIRWVMGEQSLKLLRGKKSEDVIFSGSNQKARSGFAEVSLFLENDDKPELQMSEICITRRLYRDGQSEYEINKKPVRLQDVALLLAQCGIGQRTYSVIGQGMVDAVLSASPAERKEFFDEAFGLRPFQLKRQSAINKLDESKKNLGQTEALLKEIGPRLVTLERQVKRLLQRENLQQELQALERVYYGQGWHEIGIGLKAVSAKFKAAQGEQAALEDQARKMENELTIMEKATPASQGFRELRQAVEKLSKERVELRERQLKLEAKKEIAEARAEKPWSPLPLSKIIESIDNLKTKHDELDEVLKADKPDLKKLRQLASDLRNNSSDLLNKLQRPAPEPPRAPAAQEEDGQFAKELADIAQALAETAERSVKAEAELEAWNKGEEGKRAHIFDIQHRLNDKRQEAQIAERKANELAVDIARWETRRDSFLMELRTHAPQLETSLEAMAIDPQVKDGVPDGAKLQRLRSQLEWIGSIDPETIKEHGETKERFEFLSKQVDDLRAGINSLETVIRELDSTIRDRSATAFKTLDREFNLYFKKLFDGGEGRLTEVLPEPEMDEQGNIISEPEEGVVAGVEIQATPPGKRFKSIALLSGGERALTSIALICAIMATNPSPFVVLDEVDAALDEANSRKFAGIINSLADKTQFIVVTHNRATMAEATVLYGVTMGLDGVSQLLSVKLEDVERIRNK